MLDSVLEGLSGLLANNAAAPIAAFIAGVITSLTPCSLSQVPLVLGYIGKEASPKKAFRLALVYAAGSAVTFTAFGVAASLFGMLLGAALAHNLGLAASATAVNAETQEIVSGSVPLNGKIAVIICIAVCFIIGFGNKRTEGR